MVLCLVRVIELPFSGWPAMKVWTAAAVTALAAVWAGTADATYHALTDPDAGHMEVLAPNVGGDKQAVRLSIVQVFFPGVPDRFACRMQVRAWNQSADHINVSTLLKTFDTDKAPLDSWLIPTGDLAPGQEVLRTYSCRQASSIEVSRTSEYGWPTTCVVNGEATTPCPVELHVTSSLTQPEAPDPKKQAKKGE